MIKPKSKRSGKGFRFGPGALVTAAFIGPGTVTTCSLAGASFGYALLWGLLFSVFATIVLQEMSARLGIVTQDGLGAALRKQFRSPLGKVLIAILVISAIAIGNAAFETGNILGAALGLDALLPGKNLSHRWWVLLTGAFSFALLLSGNYRLIERIMTGLVILMSIAFLATALIIKPDFGAVFQGLLVPSVPTGALITLVGLIGTTVVPYNLFLHASAVKERWKDPAELPAVRTDLSVSVVLGGIISMAVVVTSAGAFFGSGTVPQSAADLGNQLEPLWGSAAKYLIGIGLFAAGISSAVTAPLAASYATMGILGWPNEIRSLRFRLIWAGILLSGMFFALTGLKPLEVILFAQAANGILLPVIALFLISVMNKRKLLGSYVNKPISNIFGAIVVLTALVLGIRSLWLISGLL